MRIGLDMDSVLNDLETPWAAWVRKHYEPDFSYQDVKSWEWDKYTRAGNAVYDFLKISGVFRRLPVRPHAVEVVKGLVEKAHDVLIVTSTGLYPESWGDKVAWAQEHFPFVPKENLIASSRKGLLNLDVLLDDGLHNFVEFKGRGIIFNQPWNQDFTNYQGLDYLERAYGWLDFRNRLLPAQFRSCDPELGCGPSDHELVVRQEADRVANTAPEDRITVATALTRSPTRIQER